MSASKVPAELVLGTHTIGDATNNPGILHFESEAEVAQILDVFAARGHTRIDTAANYAGSEAALGRAGATKRFTVDTKIKGFGAGDGAPSKVSASIEQSLQDLQTSSVDVLYIHLPDRETPFEDTAAAINDAYRQGSFRRFGLSNLPAAEVREYLDICTRKGFVKPSVYQGQYNAIVRGGEKELFPLLREHNISFVAFSPAAGGFFSDQATTTKRWTPDNIVGNFYALAYGDPAVQAAKETVQKAAAKHGIKSHAAALRWTAYHSILDGAKGDKVAIGFSKISQLEEILDAYSAGPLPSDLADAIGAVYATVEGKEPAYHH